MNENASLGSMIFSWKDGYFFSSSSLFVFLLIRLAFFQLEVAEARAFVKKKKNEQNCAEMIVLCGGIELSNRNKWSIIYILMVYLSHFNRITYLKVLIHTPKRRL